MTSPLIQPKPLITQAVVDAALRRARVERAKAVRAVFAGLAQALRRLTAGRIAGTAAAAAR